MELKEAISKLKELSPTLIYLGDKQALQTAISHLETLQKVKEMGGVKRKNLNEEIRVNFDWIADEKKAEYNDGWNDCLNAIYAELAGKLEGLENVIENWFIALEKKQGLDQAKEIDEKGLWGADCKSVTFKEIKIGLATAIQELILGKKEG